VNEKTLISYNIIQHWQVAPTNFYIILGSTAKKLVG